MEGIILCLKKLVIESHITIIIDDSAYYSYQIINVLIYIFLIYIKFN